MKVYQKNADYSYTLGVFPTIQLLKSKPEIITQVYLKQYGRKK